MSVASATIQRVLKGNIVSNKGIHEPPRKASRWGVIGEIEGGIEFNSVEGVIGSIFFCVEEGLPIVELMYPLGKLSSISANRYGGVREVSSIEDKTWRCCDKLFTLDFDPLFQSGDLLLEKELSMCWKSAHYSMERVRSQAIVLVA